MMSVFLCATQVDSLFLHNARDHHRRVDLPLHGNRHQHHDVAKGLSSLHFKPANVISNNFGGLGPKYSDEPVIRVANVAHLKGSGVDLVISNLSTYTPNSTELNGVNGEVLFINVNRNTNLDVNFKFVSHSTDTPVLLDEFYLTIFDIALHQHNMAKESITLKGFDESYLTCTTELNRYQLKKGFTKFQGHSPAYLTNQPLDPYDLIS